MSESKHTPGPWAIERYGDGSSLVIHSDAHGLIAGLMGDADHAPEDWERWVACAKAEYARCAQAEHRPATATQADGNGDA